MSAYQIRFRPLTTPPSDVVNPDVQALTVEVLTALIPEWRVALRAEPRKQDSEGTVGSARTCDVRQSRPDSR